MTSNGHKKHAELTRPAMGNFSRNEWAIVGAPCTVIKLLADEIIKALSPAYKCAYADTSHNDDVMLLSGRLASGASIEYTDQINYNQLNFTGNLSSFNQRQLFAEADIVLVNGNHQQAKAQVVIIDENKKTSLQNRAEQLTNVELILLSTTATEVFDFIKKTVSNWESIPVYRLDETDKIIEFFNSKLEQAKSKINGLVLAGGKSVRMGFDKGAINWHGKEQRYYLADVLKNFCAEVFISCREEQSGEIAKGYETLTDTFLNLGPMGAMLSAFRAQPDNTWLVVAADLPLLDEATIQYLIDNRNTASIATAYKSVHDDFPEPLITIWEPKSYPVLLSFLAQGYSCPRKVLINSDTTLLNAPYPSALTNVNTPEELERVKRLLQQQTTTQP
ncbi:molybdopterin-guanine dinucleotide biosynthesis protein MobA [Mucilaginibacter limnophilus]|uniref:Probable molybdenum cofactor guanylyltransferase n=1 Tax=Mucilaginibacter limnophilus TaxID=1932778 RepID=A0A3S2V1E5_9SPHI|nr:NTP transferase domain-containing protein [Mucilaginibacter limnophilus]RVU00650.1 molybdopterin-guanine dinucleotide biosynthesis protein MobA [Mucilaginibacter limnophilus]